MTNQPIKPRVPLRQPPVSRIVTKRAQPQPRIEMMAPPQFSEWECYLFGTGPQGITLRPLKGHVPNFFWRFMQRILFGNKWVRRHD